MYEARGNEIWYIHPVTDVAELFLTVHPTDSSLTIEEQARRLARYLDEQPSMTAAEKARLGV